MKHEIYISGKPPLNPADILKYYNKQMIYHIGDISIWAGKIPNNKKVYIPRITYFNGGCYWKIGLRWLDNLVEISRLKKYK